MRPDPPSPTGATLRREVPALLFLAFSFALFFQDWSHPFSEMFLSLDQTVIYYPFFDWVQHHMAQGRLPLISDLAYHGAPLAAVSMVGVLSPLAWILHTVRSGVLSFNLWFLAPSAVYLYGCYFLGREFRLSRSASVLMALLASFNGHQMAQLDHLNVAWAHSFFPWSFIALLRHVESRRAFWLLLASLLWALCLLSGHPQVVFLEGLFFLGWALLGPSPSTLRERVQAVLLLALGCLVFAAPLLLFTGECLSMDAPDLRWGDIDRFYHSWTPANFMTLVLPWFFGMAQHDRAGTDYWWQYQFVEMQVAFSIAGLFFILLFFSGKDPRRRWIGFTALFGLLMAFGKFFFLYPLVQSLPVFSWFRDPARYWFLSTWALSLGAAWGWQSWFEGAKGSSSGKKICAVMWGTTLLTFCFGWTLLTWGRAGLTSLASWCIRHFLLGDGLHTQALAAYLDRVPEKLDNIAFNLDPTQPRVFLPLIFLTALSVAVFARDRWGKRPQKAFLILLVLLDLLVFRMPIGYAFYRPSDIPAPMVPAPENRSLSFLYLEPSPLPPQYGQMAVPNMNLVLGRPNLLVDGNPPLARYARISSELGWFSWVYAGRDPQGFARHPNLMRALGLDQVVTDKPLKLPAPFVTAQSKYPFDYRLPGTLPKAVLLERTRSASWPASLDLMEQDGFDPRVEAVLDQPLEARAETPAGPSLPSPRIERWDETRLSIGVTVDRPCFLSLQKTFLPGWKATDNGRVVEPVRCDLVLMGLPLDRGDHQLEFRFQPTGLRLGFFLSFIFLAFFLFQGLRLLFA